MNGYRISACAALALAGLFAVCAARADDAASLRSELEALKTQYAERIQALEKRIETLETQAAAAPPAAVAAAPQPQAVASGNAMTAFNPAMSMILSGIYTDLSRSPADFRLAGFFPAGGETGPGDRGFNLGESELTLSSNIDPYFAGTLTAAIGADNEIGIEEAFFRTSALPEGFTLKGGRFFSGLGYLNEQHAHAWDFVDAPLAYQAFLGGQLAQDGVQLKWLAPTVMFLEAGIETGNGGQFPGTRLDRNGANGAVAFVHLGNDIGESASWRAGLSVMQRRSENRPYESTDDLGAPVIDAFSGTSRLWAGDFVWKWSPHGNPVERYLKVQGEYLRRRENGTLAFDIEGADLNDSYRATQSGWYLQSVYQFMRRWRVGARYDRLDSGQPRIGLVDSETLPATAFPELLSASPTRTTLMIDWSPSEFSRLRLQNAWDDSRDDRRDRQLFLQYLYSLGAHGAHKY